VPEGVEVLLANPLSKEVVAGALNVVGVPSRLSLGVEGFAEIGLR
jgi:hypothetical protein